MIPLDGEASVTERVWALIGGIVLLIVGVVHRYFKSSREPSAPQSNKEAIAAAMAVAMAEESTKREMLEAINEVRYAIIQVRDAVGVNTKSVADLKHSLELRWNEDRIRAEMKGRQP